MRLINADYPWSPQIRDFLCSWVAYPDWVNKWELSFYGKYSWNLSLLP
jgi:hypothetical protein